MQVTGHSQPALVGLSVALSPRTPLSDGFAWGEGGAAGGEGEVSLLWSGGLESLSALIISRLGRTKSKKTQHPVTD